MSVRSATKFILKVWSLQAQDKSYFCLSSKSARNGRWRDVFFQWPVKPPEIKKFLERYPDTQNHVYFCPLPFREPIRRRELVLGSRLLWSDLDEVHPRQCDPVPQIAWQSSPDRYSALWILNDFHNPLEIEPVNRGLTYHVEADKAGWDLTQVLRIPGLRNLKYKEKPVSRQMWFTDNLYDIGDIPEGVKELDATEVLKKYKRKLRRDTLRLLTQKRATQGKRSDVIWRLENELSEQGLSRDEVYSLVRGSVWNKFRGRKDEERQLRRELDKVSDKQEQKTRAGRKSRTSRREQKKEPREKQEKTEGPIVRMSDIEPESVTWLWYPYLPRGKLVILEGDPGLGKSWVSLALAMHISSRKRFPGSKTVTKGKVLMFSAEDGLGDTIRPRLDSLGANVHSIYAYNEHVTLDEEGLEEIEGHIEEMRPRLVVIDPIVAYMGGRVDLNKANETREVMAGLGRIAEANNCTILCIRHLRKGSADKSIYRGMGSIDLTAAARSVLLVAKHPEDEEARAIAHIKGNLAPLGPTLKYVLSPGKRRPFRWDGTCDLSAEDLLSSKSEGGKSELKMAEELLNKLLAKGPVPRENIWREGEARGVSKRALNKAKREMELEVQTINQEVNWTFG